MKRFFVVIPKDEGGVELHPMKAWLRKNSTELPEDLDPNAHTAKQLRNTLRKHGWMIQEDEHEVRLMRPSGSDRPHPHAALAVEESSEPTPPPLREREWVHQLVPRLQADLKKGDPNLEVRDGYRLAYSREVLSYDGDEAKHEAGMRYETDLLIVERIGSNWTPRVVVEAKLGTVTTHDAITYRRPRPTNTSIPIFATASFSGVGSTTRFQAGSSVMARTSISWSPGRAWSRLTRSLQPLRSFLKMRWLHRVFSRSLCLTPERGIERATGFSINQSSHGSPRALA